MKRKVLCRNVIAVLAALFICASSTSCLTDIFSQEKVTSCTVNVGNTKAMVGWKTSVSLNESTIYVAVSPSPSSGEYPKAVSSGTDYLLVEGLSNGTTYTFTVENFDDDGNVYSSAQDTGTPSTDSVQTVAYDSTNPCTEVTGSFVTLTGVSDKSIVFANANIGEKAIESSDVTIATSVIGRSALTNSALKTASEQEEIKELSAGKIRHFIPPASFACESRLSKTARAAARGASTAGAFDVTNPEVGQYRSVFVDNNKELNSYEPKNVTLRAIGTATDTKEGFTEKCLLWVDDDCYTSSTSSGKKINTAVAQNLADTFAKQYYHERYVFGNECDKLINPATDTADYDMTSYSPTSTYVNIVVYDIGSDYGKSSKEQCGVVGYFYAKDYYKEKASGYKDARKYSNVGKYFYVDAAFCNLSGSDSTGYLYNGNGTKASDTVISTLVHEFQHMIDFNQKNISNKVAPDTWYNEMLSMMAEDMMQTTLGTTDAEAPRGARLPMFNQYYYYSGITDYLSDSYAIISYSTAYAFGAWLARTYGGPKLISEISKNKKVNFDSIIAAIKKQKDETVTVKELMNKYMQACVFRTDFSFTNSLPTFHQDASDAITYNGQTSQMTAIDLFSNSYKWTSDETTYFIGPILASKTDQIELRPHGFLFHALGSTTDNSVDLVFPPRRNANEVIYIYVQDKFSNKL